MWWPEEEVADDSSESDRALFMADTNDMIVLQDRYQSHHRSGRLLDYTTFKVKQNQAMNAEPGRRANTSCA